MPYNLYYPISIENFKLLDRRRHSGMSEGSVVHPLTYFEDEDYIYIYMAIDYVTYRTKVNKSNIEVAKFKLEFLPLNRAIELTENIEYTIPQPKLRKMVINLEEVEDMQEELDVDDQVDEE